MGRPSNFANHFNWQLAKCSKKDAKTQGRNCQRWTMDKDGSLSEGSSHEKMRNPSQQNCCRVK